MMLPSDDFFFDDGRRSAQIFDAACAIGSVREAGGGAKRLIGRDGCGRGGSCTVFMLSPDSFGIDVLLR